MLFGTDIGYTDHFDTELEFELTVLDGDPGNDIKAFSKVRATFRNGLMVFSKP